MTCAPRHKWHLTAGTKLLWRSWDDEFAIFNTSSGRSHVLNIVDAETLRCIEKGVNEYDELMQQVSAVLDSGDLKQELGRYLEKLLMQFEEAGLIESENP